MGQNKIEEIDIIEPGKITDGISWKETPDTMISYGIPDGISGYVTLKVYDLRGVLVKTLINKPAGPGMYSVVWDGTDTSGNSVSSGIYIYTIQAGEFTRSNKMILMR